MSRIGVIARRGAMVGLAVALLFLGPAFSQERFPPAPRPEPVAETRLLMEGLNEPNYRGLETILAKAPSDAEAWTFVRGQALLIAEGGNLLLLRPPRGRGRDVWLQRAADLRQAATRLARAAGDEDYARARTNLGDLANACNRCHQTFRVSARLAPSENPSGPRLAPRAKRPIP